MKVALLLLLLATLFAAQLALAKGENNMTSVTIIEWWRASQALTKHFFDRAPVRLANKNRHINPRAWLASFRRWRAQRQRFWADYRRRMH
jgi:hypothetical protein